jgi:hypothetical protein
LPLDVPRQICGQARDDLYIRRCEQCGLEQVAAP